MDERETFSDPIYEEQRTWPNASFLRSSLPWPN